MPRKLLVVDDSSTICEAVRYALAGEDFERAAWLCGYALREVACLRRHLGPRQDVVEAALALEATGDMPAALHIVAPPLDRCDDRLDHVVVIPGGGLLEQRREELLRGRDLRGGEPVVGLGPKGMEEGEVVEFGRQSVPVRVAAAVDRREQRAERLQVLEPLASKQQLLQVLVRAGHRLHRQHVLRGLLPREARHRPRRQEPAEPAQAHRLPMDSRRTAEPVGGNAQLLERLLQQVAAHPFDRGVAGPSRRLPGRHGQMDTARAAASLS